MPSPDTPPRPSLIDDRCGQNHIERLRPPTTRIMAVRTKMEHDGLLFASPHRKSSGVTTGHTGTGHDNHVERLEESGHHLGPQSGWGCSDQHRPIEWHAGLGGSSQTQVFDADDRQPAVATESSRPQCQSHRPASGALDSYLPPPLDTAHRQQFDQSIGNKKLALDDQRQRSESLSQLGRKGTNSHSASIEHLFDTGNPSRVFY